MRLLWSSYSLIYLACGDLKAQLPILVFTNVRVYFESMSLQSVRANMYRVFRKKLHQTIEAVMEKMFHKFVLILKPLGLVTGPYTQAYCSPSNIAQILSPPTPTQSNTTPMRGYKWQKRDNGLPSLWMKHTQLFTYGVLYGCETLRIPHPTQNRLTDGDKVVSSTRRPWSTPQTVFFCFWLSFLLDAEQIPGPSTTVSIRKSDKKN
jgi:hypothetical protein